MVDALVVLDFFRVSPRVLVVEFAQASSVEVGSDADDPCCWDGVERLRYSEFSEWIWQCSVAFPGAGLRLYSSGESAKNVCLGRDDLRNCASGQDRLMPC